MYKRTKRNTTHQYILHVAKSLFEKYGVKNVTVDRIAEASGICRSTFFTHFDSINQLLLEIADSEIDDLTAIDSSSLSGRNLILAVLYKMVDDTILYPALFMTLLSMRIASKENQSLVKVERVLQRGVEECGKTDSDYYLSRILGAYFGFINHYMINNIAFGNGEAIKESLAATIDSILS